MIEIEELDGYKVICSKKDPVYTSATLFVVRSDGEVFVGFGAARDIGKVLGLEGFVKVRDSSEYSGVMQSYCLYCHKPDRKQLPNSLDQPSLNACYECHDHIKELLERIIEENCPEVMAHSF